MSQLVYLISNLPTPLKSLFEELKQISFTFIWSGKTYKIKPTYLLAERYEAGLDVPYLPAQNKAAKIGWLHRLLNEGKNNNFLIWLIISFMPTCYSYNQNRTSL